MKLALVLLAVLLAGCGTTPLALTGETNMALQTIQQLRQQYQSGQQVVVGIIGNSIACGYRADGTYSGGTDQIAPTLLTGTLGGRATAATQALTSVGGWAQQLQVYLKAKNSTSIVQNLSGSGWTTKNHIDRGTVAAMAALTPKPTHVFIPLQVNDRGKDDINFPASVEKIPWATFIANTYTLVQAVIDAGMTPILVKENNEPFRAGTGWWWIENEYTGTGAPAGNHHAFSEYMAQIDIIAADARWVTALGGTVYVLDTYTPTLNTGQEATYVYDYGRPGGTTNPSVDLTAPSDWRYSFSKGWITPTEYPAIGSAYFDGLHPSQAGHNIILAQYKTFLSEVQTQTPTITFSQQPATSGGIIYYGTQDVSVAGSVVQNQTKQVEVYAATQRLSGAVTNSQAKQTANSVVRAIYSGAASGTQNVQTSSLTASEVFSGIATDNQAKQTASVTGSSGVTTLGFTQQPTSVDGVIYYGTEDLSVVAYEATVIQLTPAQRHIAAGAVGVYGLATQGQAQAENATASVIFSGAVSSTSYKDAQTVTGTVGFAGAVLQSGKPQNQTVAATTSGDLAYQVQQTQNQTGAATQIFSGAVASQQAFQVVSPVRAITRPVDNMLVTMFDPMDMLVSVYNPMGMKVTVSDPMSLKIKMN